MPHFIDGPYVPFELSSLYHMYVTLLGRSSPTNGL